MAAVSYRVSFDGVVSAEGESKADDSQLYVTLLDDSELESKSRTAPESALLLKDEPLDVKDDVNVRES
ncbi:hypothetical protein EVAR_38778_1 [Eumeta japonica]|uniref:Uncharacterized protein n=1 Tax=Eumeta variegata TaxID=151549 RepID=A0A4C1WMN6_EUMVA|nr:hypothetical protein EVAR_38778_1 [Eumeta japonica]